MCFPSVDLRVVVGEFWAPMDGELNDFDDYGVATRRVIFTVSLIVAAIFLVPVTVAALFDLSVALVRIWALFLGSSVSICFLLTRQGARWRLLGVVLLLTVFGVVGLGVWERRGVENCYNRLWLAMGGGRTADIYALMSPSVRDQVPLKDFASNRFGIVPLEKDRNIWAFAGRGSVYPSGGGSDFFSFGRSLKFERVGTRWYFTGEVEIPRIH